jgi:hypothetical protein
MADFSAFVASIGALSNFAKGLQSVHDEKQIFEATSDLRERIFAIQSDALTLQENHSSLLKQKDELEKKLMEFDKWENTASQYSPHKFPSGAIVYAPNESNKSPQPEHYLCPRCYDVALHIAHDVGKVPLIIDRADYFLPAAIVAAIIPEQYLDVLRERVVHANSFDYLGRGDSRILMPRYFSSSKIASSVE